MSLDNEIASGVLSTVDLLIEQRLQEVKGDKTILVTIEEQDKDDTSKYLVSVGGMKFYAYANSDTTTTYTKNQKVYVLIPEGDYNLKKIIIGSYVKENFKYSYASANKLKDYVKVVDAVTSMLITSGEDSIYESDITVLPFFKYKAPYDYINITLTPNRPQTISETLEFAFNINFLQEDGKLWFEKPIVITKGDLRGNANIFSPYIKYEFIYPLEELKTFKEVYVNSTSNSTDKRVNFTMSISFGYSKSNTQLNTNTIKIYTDQEQEYNQIDEDIVLNLEVFGAEDNLIGTGYSPTDNISELILYRYEVGTGSTDSIQGINWKQVGYYNPTLTSSLSSYQTTNNITNNGSTINLANLFFAGTETTKFKIYCKLQGQEKGIWSSVLSYINKNIDQTAKTNYGQEIHLSLSDNGIYNYYATDGTLLNDGNSTFTKEKTITATIAATGESLMRDAGSTEYAEGIERIEWIYPTKLTGIKPVYQPKVKIEGKEEDEEENSKIPVDLIDGTTNKWLDTFRFNVKNHCYDTYINNTITCNVYFKGESIPKSGSITLEFGGYKTRNTPYSLNIDFTRVNQRYISYNDILNSTPIELKATLERIDGEATDLSGTTFTWSWLEPAAAASESSTVSNTMYFVNESGTLLDNGLTYSEETTDGTSSVFIKPPVSPDIGYNAMVQVAAKNMQINDINNMDIVVYLPIAVCLDATTAGENISYMYQGPTRVVYSGFNDCSYDKEIIKLYANDEAIDLTNVTIGTWQSTSVYDLNESHTEPSSYKNHYMAWGDKEKSPNCLVLSPRSAALINQEPQINTIYIYSNNELIWMQPVLTIRDKWENTAYDWDGKNTLVGEDAMYSPFIAAGTNEADGTFTGVMLGKLSRSDKTVWGLYGTQKGNARFYMTENAEFYVGNPDVSDPYYIELNSEGELKLHLNQFYLNVPHMIIDSDSKQIDIYSDNDNTELRTRLGYIKSNTYGLDIYDGAFRLYDDQGIEMLWTDTVNDQLTLKINGWLERTEPDYTVSYTISNGTKTQTIKNSTTLKLKSEAINLGYITNNLAENWISGIIQTSNITYSIHNTGSSGTKLNTYTQGFLGGKVSGSYGDSATAPAGYCQLLSSSYENFYYIGANGRNHSSLGVVLNLSASVGNQAFSFFNGFGGSGQSNNAEIILWSRRNSGNTAPGVFVVGTFYDGSSDQRLKHSIETFPNKYELFFNALQPKRFKYKREGENAKYYNGFIAQEVIQAWEKTTGLLEKDCSLIGISPPNAQGESYYYLARDEFISLNTWQIQKLKARVTELENEIKELKQNEI